MTLITYIEAARILGVPVDTFYQALEPKRNVFIKAGRRGQNGLVIEEQVRLFLGNNPRTGRRKRLSLDALTIEEKKLWHRYASEYASNQNADAPVFPDIRQIVAEQVKQEFDRQELERIRVERRVAEENARKLNEQEERFLEGRPFLRVKELATA